MDITDVRGRKGGGRGVLKETVFKGRSRLFAVGTHQSYLHPPFPAVRKRTNLKLESLGEWMNLFDEQDNKLTF